MTRRTLDVIFATGGLIVALLILVLGLVLQNQADFAKDYVHHQLAEQRITFTPAQFLAADENAACLKSNAGKSLVTGKQAECYANNYIGLHVKAINEGKTYAETSNEARALDAQLQAMTNPNSPQAKQLAAQAEDLHGKATTLFQGETLRGLLLTSYGFSIFGDRAQTAAYVCYALALVLFLAAIAGFIHAFTKGAEKQVFARTE